MSRSPRARARCCRGSSRASTRRRSRPAGFSRACASPRAPPGARSGYVKFYPRSAEDKPLVGVAALLVMDARAGRCRQARIGLGAVGPSATRASRAEAILRGAAVDAATIQAATDAAVEETDAISDLMGSAEYRRQMVRVWVRRLLKSLADG